MPRRRRFCPDEFPVHVIQRGINGQIHFTGNADRLGTEQFSRQFEETTGASPPSSQVWLEFTPALYSDPKDSTPTPKILLSHVPVLRARPWSLHTSCDRFGIERRNTLHLILR